MPSDYINTLNQVISGITLYVPYLIIIFGAIGSLCNLLTFSSKQLLHNPCALYFFFSSVFDLLYIMFGTLTNLMNDHYTYLLPSGSIIFCKLRTYLSVVMPTLATTFLAWASIDRCLLTSPSVKWRRLSGIVTARYVVSINIGFFLLAFSHLLVYYELRLRNISSNTYSCVPGAGFYTTFISAFLLSWNSLFYCTMFAASCITLQRVRASRKRVAPQTGRNIAYPKVDRHLITIMFAQIGVGIVFSSYRVIFLAYSLLTSNVIKSTDRMAIESFAGQLSLIVYYINFAKSFPVNTLTSPLFRKIFYQRMNNLYRLLNPFAGGKKRVLINTAVLLLLSVFIY